MKKNNMFTQKGAATLWVAIAGFIIVVGVGYFIYSSQTHSPASNTGPTATSSASTIPSGVGAVPGDTTSGSPVPGGAPSGGNVSNPSGGTGNGAQGQSLDCNSFITAGDIASALGLSSQTTITIKTTGAGGCVISWKDMSVNPVVKVSPNSAGIINVGKTVYAATTAANLCKGKTSLGIGDTSCAGPIGTNPDGSIIFAKGEFLVTMSKTGPANVAGGLAAVARTIMGNF